MALRRPPERGPCDLQEALTKYAMHVDPGLLCGLSFFLVFIGVLLVAGKAAGAVKLDWNTTLIAAALLLNLAIILAAYAAQTVPLGWLRGRGIQTSGGLGSGPRIPQGPSSYGICLNAACLAHGSPTPTRRLSGSQYRWDSMRR